MDRIDDFDAPQVKERVLRVLSDGHGEGGTKQPQKGAPLQSQLDECNENVERVQEFQPLSYSERTKRLDKHRLYIVGIAVAIVCISVLPFYYEALWMPAANDAHFAATMKVMSNTYSGVSTFVMTALGAVFGFYFGSSKTGM